MHDSNELDVRKAGGWLSGDVALRVPKLWLAIGAVAAIVLVFIALD